MYVCYTHIMHILVTSPTPLWNPCIYEYSMANHCYYTMQYEFKTSLHTLQIPPLNLSRTAMYHKSNNTQFKPDC